MPTVNTVTVKSAGGDYASLSGAEAGEQDDLPTADVQLDIECYAFDDTTAVTFNGWTTDATRYIRVYTPSAERHDGKYDTSAYRLTQSGAFSTNLTINEEYVRVEGIQIRHSYTGTDEARGIVVNASGTSDIRLTESIVWVSNSGTADNSHPGIYQLDGALIVRNSVFTGGSNCITGGAADGCTAQNCTFTAANTYGYKRSSGTSTLTNCYSGGNGTDAYNGTITFTTCAHDTATSFTGSTGSIAYDTSNFTNVTGGSEDLHLVSGASSTLKTGGTDLSGTFTTDIDGETRSDWSIGADEIVAAGSAAPSRLTLLGVS